MSPHVCLPRLKNCVNLKPSLVPYSSNSLLSLDFTPWSIDFGNILPEAYVLEAPLAFTQNHKHVTGYMRLRCQPISPPTTGIYVNSQVIMDQNVGARTIYLEWAWCCQFSTALCHKISIENCHICQNRQVLPFLILRGFLGIWDVRFGNSVFR